jgi:RNA polymerase sigma factor (sigma-70 family)
MDFDQDSLTHWMNKAGAKPVLDQFEIDNMAKIIQASDPESRRYKKYVNKIVEHNLRLVVRFVHGFMTHKTISNWGSPDTLDYLQVGALGLHRAAEKYDPTRGYRFSTYATHWIRSFVGRYNLKTMSTFTIPEHASRNAHYFESHGEPKTRKSGVVPTKEETVEMVKMLRSAQFPASLDTCISDHDNITLLDTLESHYNEGYFFTEGCFDTETEDLLVKAGLSGKQILILRGLYVDNAKATDIQKSLSISQGQYLKLKKQALDSLKEALEPV